MRRLFHGCITTRRGRQYHNSNCVGMYASEPEALGAMVRLTCEQRPAGWVIVSAACWPLADGLVVAAAEELGCVKVY